MLASSAIPVLFRPVEIDGAYYVDGGVRLNAPLAPAVALAANPNPTFIPAANRAAQWLAERIGGIPQSGTTEALLNVPSTAHILGGAVIAGDPSQGVVDARGQVFGYENLLITDGSALPANPGVNPSLTITALAEHTIAQVPATLADQRPARRSPAN